MVLAIYIDFLISGNIIASYVAFFSCMFDFFLWPLECLAF